MPVPCVAQMTIGRKISTIAAEYPMATPEGPLCSPAKMPRITAGQITNAVLRLLPTCPVARKNQEKGLSNASTITVGDNRRKTGTDPAQFGPRTTQTISSAKSAELITTGMVSETMSDNDLRYA